jgi:hypothetical protein
MDSTGVPRETATPASSCAFCGAPFLAPTLPIAVLVRADDGAQERLLCCSPQCARDTLDVARRSPGAA